MRNSQLSIFYLSGTGNCLKTAKDIIKTTGYGELISIAGILRNKTLYDCKSQTIGFVFPVYFANPPAAVLDTIRYLNIPSGAYLFAVATGGGLLGRALRKFNHVLKKKGNSLNAGFFVQMPGNHPKIASMQSQTPSELYINATEKIRRIAETVISGKNHKPETNFGPAGYLFSHLVFKKLNRISRLRSLDRELWSNDACDTCGICLQVCPMENIRLDNGKPVWSHNCINCLACYHACPPKAIQLGKEKRMENYRHPEISLTELYRQ